MKWQPIETAPKDGTKILVYVSTNEYNDIGVALVLWGSLYTGSTNKKYFGWHMPYITDEEGWYYEVGIPTHWMPLPESPEKREI